VLNWEPVISLEEGLTTTYHWIAGELEKRNTPVKALVTS
jgi:nucleoside-diphosphate-sugar epimerase